MSVSGKPIKSLDALEAICYD